MNYRICIATSGYYYVQRCLCCGTWRKHGAFFRTKAGARAFIRDLKSQQPCCEKVVEYH